MCATTTAKNKVSTGTWSFQISLRLTVDGPEVTREPVTEPDLADLVSEAWLAGCLRKGHPHQSLEEVPALLAPVQAADMLSCTGFTVNVTCPGGEINQHEFPRTCLQPVAARAAQRLLAEGRLAVGGDYYMRLMAEPRPPGPDPVQPEAVPFAMETRERPLEVLSIPLNALLSQAEPVGESQWDGLPIFYTQQAFDRAERYSRRGAASQPPLETGAVLVGSLCSCSDSGEFFAVVDDVLEVLDAEQTSRSLTYSGKSWERIQTVIQARQAQPKTRSQRILGQAHGHNFPPSLDPPCASCKKADVCPLTSVFVSADDSNWSRAVFRRQPWHICHIFGVSARNEPVHGLFGLHNGSLAERGFHVIPDFDIAAWGLLDRNP